MALIKSRWTAQRTTWARQTSVTCWSATRAAAGLTTHSGTTLPFQTPGSAAKALHRRVALAGGLVVLGALIAGVGIWRLTLPQNSTEPRGADYSELSELGATKLQWNAKHTPDPGGTDTSFLPRNLNGLDRFVNVTFDHGRVSGFIMQFDEKTVDEASAKVIALEQLPPDAKLVFESRRYVGTTDVDDQCDQLQYQSTAIGTLLAQDRGGVISVVIWSPTPQGLLSNYDPAGITSINILATGTLGVIPTEC